MNVCRVGMNPVQNHIKKIKNTQRQNSNLSFGFAQPKEPSLLTKFFKQICNGFIAYAKSFTYPLK